VTGSLSYRILVVILVGFAAQALLEFGLVRVGLVAPEGWSALLWSAGLSAAAVAWALDRLVLRRIRGLNHDLREVAAGDLQRRLTSRSHDELGQLVSSINSMVKTLRDNYEELRTNDELRRRLVANVSHELRTPLTSIQGYIETARNAGPASPDFASNLQICHRETRRLANLVQDLFQLSKLDTQQLEFHFETVSLVELADQVGLAFEQRMEDKDITFTTSFPDAALDVVGDGNRLGQVITNLLGNAAVFTPEGGEISLECHVVDGRAVCSVRDTGIGIGRRELPHIFESFFHLEKSRTRNLGGTGLGLAICKAIIDAHGGVLDVESDEGVGSRFWFALDQAPEVPSDEN
jgi:signal transduction histidine kinase